MKTDIIDTTVTSMARNITNRETKRSITFVNESV